VNVFKIRGKEPLGFTKDGEVLDWLSYKTCNN
jgi:hypothetical protein